MVFTLINDRVIVVTTSSSTRFTIKGIEDGDCIQAYPHQWSLDHLPSFLPPAPNVICNYILQTILLWSSCDSKLVHLIGDNHFICEVSVKQKKHSFNMFNWKFSVMEKLPSTSYVRLVDIWLIFGQLIPFIQANINKFQFNKLYFIIIRLFCSQLLRCTQTENLIS